MDPSVERPAGFLLRLADHSYRNAPYGLYCKLITPFSKCGASASIMRISEKLELIDKIGRELQSRYTYGEIDAFLAEFGVTPPTQVNSNSKWVYSKAALGGQNSAIILRVASELGLVPESGVISEQLIAENDRPPRNWEGSVSFRLFISHVSVDKLKATRLKECLLPYSISGFVAHEDIAPTLEWQGEIERGLRTMDALLAIHTPGFSKSNWCQQEVGFALGRGVKIISLKMGEDPTGFIGKHQALARRDRVAEEIAKEVDAILSADTRTRDALNQAKGRLSERPSLVEGTG